MRVALVAALAAALVCGAAAADTVRSLPGREVGSDDGAPQWSPDGTQILFGRGWSTKNLGEDHALAIVRPDGTGFRRVPRPQLGCCEVWDLAASFSPDGKTLLLSRELGLYDYQVFVKDIASGAERRLTPPNVEEIGGNWSPDGGRVLVVRIGGQLHDEWTPYSERPDGTDARQIAPPGRILYAQYLADGSIVITRLDKNFRSTVEVVTPAGATRTVAPLGRWDVLAATRDGRRLLLLRDSGESNESLWTVNVDGTGLRRLVAGEDGTWSPDDTQIAYTPTRFGRDHAVYVIPADGGERRRLVLDGASPAWSSDGKQIAYAAYGPCGHAGIYVVPSAGGRSRRLTQDCRIIGTARDDLLLGTSETDVIVGGRGNDVVRANPGDRPPAYYGNWDFDVVVGGPGNDTIYGGRGIDTLEGGPGDDRVFGGRGPDRIYGGSGNDLLDGGRYDDRIFAADGQRDVVRCGSGEDRAVVDRLDVLSDCEHVARR